MNSSVIRTTPLYPIRRIAAVTAVALAAVVAASTISLSQRTAGRGENAVDRCERALGGFGKRLAAAGVAIDTADYRRQRFAAFATCLENPDAFAGGVGPQAQSSD
jgi:hypothetical protein